MLGGLMRVAIKLTDPWEMGDVLGWAAIPGTVLRRDAASWLVELDTPVLYSNTEYRFLIVSSRHGDIPLAEATLQDVSCNMIRTTTERASSTAPCDASWWRGGHAMIGSIRVEAAQPAVAADGATPRR